MNGLNDPHAWLAPMPALAAVLVDAALKSALVLAVAGLAMAGLRRASAATRHGVWFLAVASLLVLPVLSWALPQWRVLPGWLSVPKVASAPVLQRRANGSGGTGDSANGGERRLTGANAADPSPQRLDLSPGRWPGGTGESPVPPKRPEPARAGATPTQPPSRTALSWPAFATAAWVAGASLVLLATLAGMASLWYLKRGSRRETAPTWMELLRRLLACLRFQRRVELLKTAHRRMPMTWGLLRPKVLLPEASQDWPEERRRVVLLHELAHAKRWDYATNLITQLACALYWFNPLVWLAARRMAAERERACDDIVLSQGADPADYAEQILQIAAGLPLGRIAAFGAIPMARLSNLEGRLRAILDAQRNRAALTRLGLLAALVLLTAIVVPVAMLRAAESGKPPASAAAAGARTNTVALADPKRVAPDNPLGLDDATIIRFFTTGQRLEAMYAMGRSIDPWTNATSAHPGQATLASVEKAMKQSINRDETGDDPFGQGKLRVEVTATNNRTLVRVFSVGPDGVWNGGEPIHEPALAGDLGLELEVGKPDLRWLAEGTILDYLKGTHTARYLAGKGHHFAPPIAQLQEADQKLLFGPVVDGLRAAVELTASNGVFVLGEPIHMRFHLQNASDHDIQVPSEDWRQGDEMILEAENGGPAQGGNGRPVMASHVWYSGWPRIQRETLKPGQMVVFGSSDLMLLPEIGGEQILDKFTHIPPNLVGRWATLPPGRYQIHFQMSFPGWNAQLMDWQGALETGTNRLELKAASKPPNALPTTNAQPAIINPPSLPPGFVSPDLPVIAEIGGSIVDDETGLPVADFRIQEGVANPDKLGENNWSLSYRGPIMSGPPGRFTLQGRQKGQVWRVLASGYEPQMLLEHPLTGTIQTRSLVVRLKRSGEKSGQPLPDVPTTMADARSLTSNPGGAPSPIANTTSDASALSAILGAVVDDETGEAIADYGVQAGVTNGPTPGEFQWGQVFPGPDKQPGILGRGGWEPAQAWRVLAAGYVPQTVTIPSISQPNPTNKLVVRMKRGGELHGVVLDFSGQAVPGAHVYLANDQFFSVMDGNPHQGFHGSSTTTDAAGRFALRGADGAFQKVAVVSTDRLMVWPAQQTASGEEMKIILPKPAVLTVRYSIPGDEQAAQFHFRRHAMNIPPSGPRIAFSRVEKVPNGGTISLTNLAPGTFDFTRQRTLQTDDGGHLAILERRTITLEAGQTQEVSIVRVTGQHLSGNIQGIPDNVFDGCLYVRGEDATGDPSNTRENILPCFDALKFGHDGHFQTVQLEPGNYTLVAQAYAPRLLGTVNTNNPRHLPDYVGVLKVSVPTNGLLPAVKIELIPKSNSLPGSPSQTASTNSATQTAAKAPDPDNPLNLDDDLIIKLFKTGQAMREVVAYYWSHKQGAQFPVAPGDLQPGPFSFDPLDKSDPFGNGSLRLRWGGRKLQVFSVGPDGQWDDGRLARSDDPKRSGDLGAEFDPALPITNFFTTLKWLNDGLLSQYLEGGRTSHYLAKRTPHSVSPSQIDQSDVFLGLPGGASPRAAHLTTQAPSDGTLNYGPLVDGLRAAVELVVPYGVAVGEAPIPVRFHIRNEAGYDIHLNVKLTELEDAPIVEDEAGQKMETDAPNAGADGAAEKGVIMPGQEAVLHAWAMVFHLKVRNAEGKILAAYSAKVDPGRYTVRFPIRLPQGFSSSLSPLDWQGTLMTGPLTVDVLETAGPSANPAPADAFHASADPASGSASPASTRTPKSSAAILAELRNLLPEDWTCKLILDSGGMEGSQGFVKESLFRLDFTNAAITFEDQAGGAHLGSPHPNLRLYFLSAAEETRLQRKTDDIRYAVVFGVGETPDYFAVTSFHDINSGVTSTLMERAMAPLGRALAKYFGKLADDETGDVLGMATNASDGLTTGIGVTGLVVDNQTGKPIKEFRVEWSVGESKMALQSNLTATYFGGRFGEQFHQTNSVWYRVEFGIGQTLHLGANLKAGDRVWPRIQADGYLPEPLTPEPVVWPVRLTNLVIRLKRADAVAQPAAVPASSRREETSANPPPTQTNGLGSVVGTNSSSVSGSVVDDETGQPIKDFTVTPGFTRAMYDFLRWVDEEAARGTNGFYRLDLVDEGALLVEAGGYAPEMAFTRTNTTLNFRLRRGQIVAGTVMDPSGKPASHAQVSFLVPYDYPILKATVFRWEWEGLFSLMNGPTARSEHSPLLVADDQGRFSLPATAGAKAFRAVHESGYAEVAFERLPMGSNSVIRLQPWARIEGTLRGKGQPVTNVMVGLSLSNPWQQHLSIDSFAYRTNTDSSGHFVFDRVPPGEFEVYRERGDYPYYVTLDRTNSQKFGERWVFPISVKTSAGKTAALDLDDSQARPPSSRQLPGSSALTNQLSTNAPALAHPAPPAVPVAPKPDDSSHHPQSDWGEPVEGVSVRLQTDKTVLELPEVPRFRASVRNQGHETISVAQTQQPDALEVDGVWYSWSNPYIVTRPPLAAGAELGDIPVTAGGAWSHGLAPLVVAPGRHTFRFAVEAQRSESDRTQDIRAISNPVKVEMRGPAQMFPALPRPANGAATVTVSGTVIDADTRQPIPSFIVKAGCAGAAGSDLLLWTKTKTQGVRGAYRIELDVGPSSPVLMVYAEGYAPELMAVGTKAACNFELRKSDGFSGKVVDAHGQPVGGAEVALGLQYGLLSLNQDNFRLMGILQDTTPHRGPIVFSDADGDFKLPAIGGAVTVVAVHRQLGFAQIPVEQNGKVVTVQLQPWARIEGVLRQGAQPLADQAVGLVVKDPLARGYVLSDVEHQTTTDAQGRFVFEQVPPGEFSLFRQLGGYYQGNGFRNGVPMSYAFVSTGGPVERAFFPNSTVKTEPGKSATVTLDANAQEPISSETNQSASATPPSSPQSDWWVTNIGVWMRLRADRPQWGANEIPAFEFDLFNSGRFDLVVYQLQEQGRLEVDGTWYDWMGGGYSYQGSPLPPGREYQGIPLTLTSDWRAKPEPGTFTGMRPLKLLPGKHTIRFAMTPSEATTNTAKAISTNSYQPPVAVSNPVEIEVTPGAEAPVVPSVRWGSPAQGLSVTLSAEHFAWTADDSFIFRASVTNQGSAPIKADGDGITGRVELDGIWYSWNGGYTSFGNILAPGGYNTNISVRIGSNWRTDDGHALRLAAGRHTVRFAERAQPAAYVNRSVPTNAGPVFHAISNPIQIDIAPGVSARAAAVSKYVTGYALRVVRKITDGRETIVEVLTSPAGQEVDLAPIRAAWRGIGGPELWQNAPLTAVLPSLKIKITTAQEAEEVTRLILNEFRGSGLDEQNWGMKAQPWSGGWRVMPSYIGPPSQVMYVGPLELKLENGILRDVAEEGWEYKAP